MLEIQQKSFFAKKCMLRLSMGLFVLLASIIKAQGQEIGIISNPSGTVYQGDYRTYSLSSTDLNNLGVNPEDFISYDWNASVPSIYENETSMQVQWTNIVGNTYIDFEAETIDGWYYGSLTVYVNPVAPDTPANPTVQSSSPGSVTLQRTGTPPNGVIWYWQTSASGTSTTNGSGSTKTVTSGSIYYIRAQNSSGMWSTGSGSVQYIIPIIPPVYTLSNENYIYTIAPQIETTDISSLNNGEKIESVTYFDGLGRPKQSVGIRAGSNSEDVVTYIGYDAFGRQDKEYLPYATTTNGGLYRNDAFNPTFSFYNTTKYENTLNPYSEKHLEASPLNRVLEQGAPGADWAVDEYSDSDHTIKFDYQTNTGIDYVKQYSVSFVNNNIETPQLVDNGIMYSANELFKTVTKDENWQPNQTYPNDHTTEEYKDKQGRVILKRTFNAGKWHDTYYVYDDYGNLTYVLPPKVLSYESILQQKWIGQYFYFDDVAGLCTQETSSSYVEFDFSDNGTLYVYIYAYDSSPITLADGLIMNLDIINPSLPDMNLGNIQFQGGNNAGTAYIQSGNLYFNSSGLSSSGSTSHYFDANFSIDLSNYENSFTPPPIDQTQLDNLAYQYRYDSRNRLVEKKIPGKGTTTDWEEIVYNKLDQPILTRDPNLRAQGKWLFTKYDAFGRVAYTGIMNSTDTRANLQLTADGFTTKYESRSYPITIGGASINYTNHAYPQTILEVYTINYYDDYNFVGFETMPQYVYGQKVINYSNAASTRIETKGLATYSKVRVLDSNPVQWVTTVTGYDVKARPIYVKNVNEYLGTTDIVSTHLDFVGKVKKTQAYHQKVGQIDYIITTDTFEYDHAGRLVSQKQNINHQGEELIAKNHYDELGQLIKKDVGHTELQPLQQVDYTYNIRGWLKNINDPTDLGQDGDLFSFGLNYNKPEGPPSYYITPLYNGNISHTYWKTNNEDDGLRHYNYKYDALNRFTNAYFSENNGYNSKFNEYIYDYDRNGNMGRLLRYGQHPTNSQSSYPMDNLAYAYDEGNKLISVKDYNGTNSTSNTMGGFKDGNTVGNDYAYDVNGNMKEDLNKGITAITYNHLNLPTSVNFSVNGSQGPGTISYIYDAVGTKLKKVVSAGIETTTEYAGNYVYKQDNQNTAVELQFFNHPEGYVDAVNGYKYVYQYKDHLGNVRLSYQDTNGNYKHILDSDFTNSFDSWEQNGSVNYSLDNGRLKANVNSAYEGVKHSLNGFTTTAGEVLNVSIIFDKGNTQSNIRLYLHEVDPNGNLVNYNVKTSNLQTGSYKFSHTMVNTGNSIIFRIDKENTNTTTETYFYIDHVSLIQNDLEILEENNYYPFGLEHKGYNSNVISENNYFNYNGKELEKSLGLNWLDLGARNLDPALGRFMNIDPLAEEYDYQSTYAFAANNPVFHIDFNGEGVYTKYIDERDGKVLLDTNDGSDDVVTIAGEDVQEFVELTSYTDQSVLDSPEWNLQTKTRVLGFETTADTESFLGAFSTQSARQAGINYIQDPTISNALAAEFKNALGQWTKPENLISALASLGSLIKTKVPGGRLGNNATRRQNAQIASELEKKGYTITGGGGRMKEEYLRPIGGGRKGGSYPDITATKDGRTLRVNTVDTKANGTMTTREATNAARIRAQRPNDHLLTIPKKQ